MFSLGKHTTMNNNETRYSRWRFRATSEISILLVASFGSSIFISVTFGILLFLVHQKNNWAFSEKILEIDLYIYIDWLE